jgi:hypothetical protein
MDAIVVIGSAALALLGSVILIIDLLQTEDQSTRDYE